MHVICESVLKRIVPDEDHKWMYLLVNCDRSINFSLVLTVRIVVQSLSFTIIIIHCK